MTDLEWLDVLRLATSTGLRLVAVDRAAQQITLQVPPVKR